MTDTQIKVLSVLSRAGPDDYTLLVRWLLGDRDGLPLHDDTFRVRLLLRPSGKVIFANGNVGDPDGSEWIDVRPRLYAMIDPPRRSEPMDTTPPGDTFYRLVARQPTGPIDPDAAASGSLREPGTPADRPETRAMGVYHLLSEAEPSREAWRIADAAALAMRRRLAALRSERGGFSALTAMAVGTEDPADVSAKALARYLITSGMRPLDLPKVMTDAVAEFRARVMAAAATGAAPTIMPRVFAMSGADITAQAEHAALMTATLNDHEVLDSIDRERTSRLGVRQQLRLRALQGGELIDFWCNPDSPVATCVPDARGKRYPASELIGLGLRVFGIDAALVRDWATGPDRQMLQVEVEHQPGSDARSETPFGTAETNGPGNLVFDGIQPAQWDPGQYIITTNALVRAVQDGGTELPPPPAAAEINYDLTQSNAGDEPGARPGLEPGKEVTFETGEGKVQILIKGPTASDDEPTTVFSYNLYGVWEGAPGTDALFADPPSDPSPDELRALLKPYRMSARYSFSRDLLPAFGDLAPHPAIESLLSDPPWFPILVRPTAAYEPEPQSDTGEDSPRRPGRPLPIVGRDGMTATSIDLRKGLSFDADHSGYAVTWDPFGPLEQRWSPETTRDGSPAGDRPQHYRFWVTSVDAFEQESDPVPVRANDADAGEAESFLYVPRYRTPLPPPRGVENKGVRVAFDDARGLVVEWRTPFAERLGVDATRGEQNPLLDKRLLKASIRLYRRRISPFSPRDAELVAMETSGDLPQWREAAESMREQGYDLYRTATEIAPPDDGETWSHVFELDWADRGFEYIAGVAFEVVDAWRPFWAPNTLKTDGRLGRQVILQRLVGDSYEPVKERIAEVPQVSDVSISPAYLHTNPARPRPVTGVSDHFDRAEPVLPVQEVQRDTVLLRLLTHDIEGTEPTPWRDTGVALTDGQKAMCETAILRVRRSGDVAPDPDEAELADLRRIFARRLQRDPASPRRSAEPLRTGKVLHQHPTVGFRGIQTLAWRYRPFAAEAPVPEREAEAALVRIYQVRVPITRIEAASYATVRGAGSRIDGQPAYRLSGVDVRDPEALSAIATEAAADEPALGQPAAVLIDLGADAPPIVRTASVIDITDPASPVVTLTDASDLPASATIMLFAARDVAERGVPQFDTESADSIQLPVGGGFPEFFIWWLVSVSAQGKEAAPDGRPSVIVSFPMTIEPEPPSLFAVTPPTHRTAHALDPSDSAQARFLPDNIDTIGNALNNPRLLLTWKDPRRRAKARLVLYRRRQRVDAERGDTAPFADSADFAGWIACKEIEGLAQSASITQAQLSVLERGWLRGKALPAPEDSGPSRDEIFITADADLSSAKGVKEVDVPVEDWDGQTRIEKRPAFIDYYYRNGDRRLAMEGSFSYAYSAARAIDLDPEDIHSLPPERRFLLSRRTSWSPFILPATVPFEILPGKPEPRDTPSLPPTGTPEVVFRFTTPQTLTRDVTPLDEDPVQFRAWFYRIVVRRRIDAGFASSGGEAFQPQWVEVGQPGCLTYDGAVEIRDTGIDRPAPDSGITCWYSIGVTQMAEITDSLGRPLGEVMVRRGEKDDGKDHVMQNAVVVPPMLVQAQVGGPDKLIAERRVVVPVEIR